MEQCSPGVLFRKLYKVLLGFKSADEILVTASVTRIGALTTFLRYCLLLRALVLNLGSVDDILKRGHLTVNRKATDQYVPVVLFIVQQKMVLTFEICGWNP